MKKSISVLTLVGLVALSALSWGGSIQGQQSAKTAYDDTLRSARRYAEKQIYVDAITQYKKVLEVDKQNYNVTLELADSYYNLGDITAFVDVCKSAIDIDKTKSTAYMKMANYYVSAQQYNSAIQLLKSASKVIDRDEIDKLAGELKYKTIEKYISAAQIGDWHTNQGASMATYEYKEKWGIISENAKKMIAPQYEYIGVYDKETGVIPCKSQGEYYYIDANGYRKLVGDKDYEYLGSFGNGVAPAKYNGKYGYINTLFNEKNFEYDYAGAFANGVAAVQKEGKWGVINKEFKMVTGFDYDNILVDSNGFCSKYNVIVAVQNGKYILMDKQGKKLGDKQFDEAKMAASNEGAIAVKENGKWGFADSKGNMVINATYDDAYSFSLGLAPVTRGTSWGYIDHTGNMVIAENYTEARPFTSNGSALILQGTQWNILKLCEYGN